jgi:hypothetical protein
MNKLGIPVRAESDHRRGRGAPACSAADTVAPALATSISINLLRKAIVQKLAGEFPSTPVYAEEIKQGFKKPCFFVAHEETEEQPALGRMRSRGKRFLRQNQFSIYFYTLDGENQNEQAFDMGEMLFDVLSYVEINETRYGGFQMSVQCSFGVLRFSVSYDFHIFKTMDYDKMEKLEHKIADLTSSTEMILSIADNLPEDYL